MNNKKIDNINYESNIEELYSNVSSHIDNARNNVVRTINIEMVNAYWLIGRDIVLHEQRGEIKAGYGKRTLSLLSSKLNKKYGKGFSIENLTFMRKFYTVYQGVIENKKSYALRTELPKFSQNLSWTHYRSLIKISTSDKRKFYEEETIKNNWSARELDRQINSLLYDRIIKSKNKAALLSSVNKETEKFRADLVVKDPTVLEFLNLPESSKLVESKLEQALIDNLQQFLLEFGPDIAFVSRQKRITIDGDHFYIDLVLYHMRLKCFIIVEIKTRDLEHGDLGQIQLYVNYYDKEKRYDNDNPTIGLVLCTRKNDAMVKYLLGEGNNQIFASQYLRILLM